ncbi:sodium:solute symporter family protein [Sulfoacidibacillus thermotolerans]|uniref:Sodium:solute symporter n=1 Tax=Sulfoacidibacillus thermotolerans TaxID=1765684 RepID=A0A2U3DAI0_SULT2|nr:sodium:solute symporter family protein [Sulfoacidibacillus thermotolerans]PWI58289.1 sodium:solute symporter [Sulfoacidibacillus thermotolerans]
MQASALLITFGTMLLALALGLAARRKRSLNLEQWTVGGRGFGILFVFLLLAGEIYTTFTFLGGSSWAYGVGGPTVYILAYGAIAYILSYFLLPPIWRYGKRHQLISQPDYFWRRFNSKGLSIFVAIVGVIAMIPYLQLQITGLGLIMQTTSYGAINQATAMIIGVIVLAIYVTISGVYGTAWTAVIKDIAVLAIVLIVGIALPLHVGGFQAMFEKINTLHPHFLTLQTNGMGVPWFISTVLLTSLGFYMWPHSFGAVYTAKNERVFRRNATFLPLYQLILLFVFFAGFAALLIVPGLKNTNLALLAAVQKVFPAWFVGVIGGAGILTALVPGSLLLMAASTLIAENIYRPLTKAMDSQVQTVARIMVWVLGAVTLYFSLHSNATIVALLLMGYNFVTQFFPSVVLSLFWPRVVNKYGAFSGILVGVALVIAFAQNSVPIIWHLNSGFVAFLANFLTVLLISSLSGGGTVLHEETV